MTQVDDTDLDSLAAQVHAFPALALDEVTRLLGAVRAEGRGPAHERLVEHHLDVVLREALARGDRGVDVPDLYQEGTLATVVAISEYAARDGVPAGLRGFVTKVVGAHLDATLEEAVIEQQSEEAFVRDAERFESVEVGLRHELGRRPSPTELAAVLQWSEDRVVIVGEMLNEARAMYDTEIISYLEDEESG